MQKISSGCYVIDKDYNVVSVNETAKTLYPQLVPGKKCYKCLMGLDAPCPPCPVKNGLMGPHTYADPIRHIAETVDAVEVDVEGHGPCHALIFSTVGERADFAATLPTEVNELQKLALVKALTVDYYDVFAVHLENGNTTLYRHNGQAVQPEYVYRHISSYEKGMEEYIDRYVIEEDKESVRRMSRLSYICGQLKEKEFMTIHYRVMHEGDLHYYYRRIARIGDKESFSDIVVGVACEDETVINRMRNETLLQNLSEVEYDLQTGLYTREAFLVHGEELLKRYPDKDFDFCISKIENLSLINHQYGRAAGDRTVKLMGDLLKQYDDEYTCLTYMGDGTFASFTLNEPANIRKAKVWAFRDMVLEQSRIKGVSLKWSIYTAPRKDLSVAEIMAKTQYALSTIRKGSREEYVEYDQSVIDRMEWERRVENHFEEFLERNEFKVWYQPKYSIRTGKIVEAEALVRWFDENGNKVSPGEFISVLEACGKIHMLDTYVFGLVCRLQKKMKDMGLPTVPISVNLSRASMFTENLADQYAKVAESYGISPRLVPVEITESAAVRSATLTGIADKLIGKGFSLHMDDFGSGYSSLASLQAIPFESIKLDKTLVDYIGRAQNESLLKHTIAFAKENGKRVVAEGVENYEQYIFLKFAGCDMVQGFYFSKPVEEDIFISMMRENS